MGQISKTVIVIKFGFGANLEVPFMEVVKVVTSFLTWNYTQISLEVRQLLLLISALCETLS